MMDSEMAKLPAKNSFILFGLGIEKNWDLGSKSKP
jgi:hypothetical protein